MVYELSRPRGLARFNVEVVLSGASRAELRAAAAPLPAGQGPALTSGLLALLNDDLQRSDGRSSVRALPSRWTGLTERGRG